MNRWPGTILYFLLLLGFGYGIWRMAGSQACLTSEHYLLLLGLPVAWSLGRPWVFAERPSGGMSYLLAAACAAAFGGVFASVTLLSLAWILMLAAWLRRHLEPACFGKRVRLLALAAVAFPWLLVDGVWLGWWFRLSGACVAAELGQLVGFHVTRDGTLLAIEGAPLSVEAACSGLQSLQIMVSIGVYALFRQRGPTAPLLVPLVFLFVLAWFSNTLRILAVAVLALTFGPESANGVWHDLSGILSLVLMFWFATLMFERWDRPPIKSVASAST